MPVREQEKPDKDAKEMTAGVADVEVFFVKARFLAKNPRKTKYSVCYLEIAEFATFE